MTKAASFRPPGSLPENTGNNGENACGRSAAPSPAGSGHTRKAAHFRLPIAGSLIKVIRMSAQWTTAREYTDIKYETTDDGSIAKITINRPHVRNAFRPLTVHEMLNALNAAHEDPKVGVVILTGEGPDAFCSGGDQKVRGNAGYIGEDGVPRLNILDVQRTIRTMPKPVVAMVAGYAIGGGHVLHVVCDLTIAADNAKFGQPELSLASIPCFGATQLLTKAIGKAKAMEVILSGRAINAEEAERTGLVSRIIPLTDLYDECYKVAAKIAEQSDLAVSTAKQAIKQAAANTPLATGIALENQSSRMCLDSEDFRESLADFIRKHS